MDTHDCSWLNYGHKFSVYPILLMRSSCHKPKCTTYTARSSLLHLYEQQLDVTDKLALSPTEGRSDLLRLWRPLYASLPQGFASKNCDIQWERAVYQSSIRHIAHVGTLTASNPRELNWQHVEHVGITVHRSSDRGFFFPPFSDHTLQWTEEYYEGR